VLDSANTVFDCGCGLDQQAYLTCEGQAGSTAAQAGHVSRYTVHLHSSCLGLNLGLKSLNRYSGPSPTLSPSIRAKPVGPHYTRRVASWRSPYTYNTRLDSEKKLPRTRAHVHSVLAVPWHNARRWLLGMAYGSNQRPVSSGMKQALTHLWTVELACQQDNFTSFRVMLMIFFGALGCAT